MTTLSLDKSAKTVLEPADDTMTDRFYDLHRRMMTMEIPAGGAGFVLAAAMQGNEHKSKKKNLPDYDPKTNAYIGRAYKLPDSEEALLRLHKQITGKGWKSSAPKVLEWLLAPRKDRIALSLSKAIYSGRAPGAAQLTPGEKATLLFPRILMKDNTAKKGLGILTPYPIHYGWTNRPFEEEDFKE